MLLDLHSHAVAGWAMDPRMTGDLLEQTLHMALTIRQPEAGLLHHFDRGSQGRTSNYSPYMASRPA